MGKLSRVAKTMGFVFVCIMFVALSFVCAACGCSKHQAEPETQTYCVKFLDYDSTPLGVLINDEVVYEQKVKKGEAAVAPVNPTRPGYEFESWDRDFSNVTRDLEVQAEYVKVFEVQFLDYDYTIFNVQNVRYGKSAVLPSQNPQRIGYRFDHWEGNYANIVADVDIYAVYVRQYKVRFEDFDGTEIATVVVDEGKSAQAPAIPERDGYTFDEWSADFSNVTEDMVVTARYKELTYQVKFYDYNKQVIKTEKVYHGTGATAPDLDGDIKIDWSSEQKGYQFDHWDKTFDNVNSNLDVYAVYSAITKPILYVESESVVSGAIPDYVSVRVYVISSVPFSALEINLSYNSNLSMASKDNIYVKNMFNAQDRYNLTLDTTDHEIRFSWYASEETSLPNNYLEVFELRFQVDRHLPVGEYEIELLSNSNYVKDLTKQVPVMISGAIKISEEVSNDE